VADDNQPSGGTQINYKIANLYPYYATSQTSETEGPGRFAILPAAVADWKRRYDYWNPNTWGQTSYPAPDAYTYGIWSFWYMYGTIECPRGTESDNSYAFRLAGATIGALDAYYRDLAKAAGCSSQTEIDTYEDWIGRNAVNRFIREQMTAIGMAFSVILPGDTADNIGAVIGKNISRLCYYLGAVREWLLLANSINGSELDANSVSILEKNIKAMTARATKINAAIQTTALTSAEHQAISLFTGAPLGDTGQILNKAVTEYDKIKASVKRDVKNISAKLDEAKKWISEHKEAVLIAAAIGAVVMLATYSDT